MKLFNKSTLKHTLYAMAMAFFLASCGGGATNKGTENSDTAAVNKNETASTTEKTEESPEEKAKKDFEENTLKKYPQIVDNLVRRWKEVSFEHKDGKIENVEKENDYLIFKKDGTFEEYFHTDKKIEAGRWRLVKEGKVLHLTSTEHRVMQDVERDIVELTADKFVWLDNIKKKSTFKAVAEEKTEAGSNDKPVEKPVEKTEEKK